MKKRVLGSCPVCSHELKVTELRCSHCDTVVSGEFDSCAFCQLNNNDRYFVETFVRCRGSIKEVEKELGISYPTVRSRLDNVMEALGYTSAQEKQGKQILSDVLRKLDSGELDVQEALKLINRTRKDDHNE